MGYNLQQNMYQGQTYKRKVILLASIKVGDYEKTGGKIVREKVKEAS